MAQPNHVYVTISRVGIGEGLTIGGVSDAGLPVVNLSGIVLAPDGSVVISGFSQEMFFNYGDSLEDIRAQVLPYLESGYSLAGPAEVIILP